MEKKQLKKRNVTLVFGGLLLAIPVFTANGQDRVAQPGTFDPLTETAHQKGASEPENTASSTAEPIPNAAVKIPGRIIVPSTTVARPEDIGFRAHTNYLVFVPQSIGARANLATGNNLAPAASITPDTTFAENPGSLGCIYQVGPAYLGCTPSNGAGHHPLGGSGAIAIVDAYNNPDAASDLSTFDSYWGLPSANFTQVYCLPSHGSCETSNTPPANDKGWALEEALDIEYAHAMAPYAKIFLVEAASSSNDDLTWANIWAAYYVDISGGGEVSNSWGSAEFSTESSYDSIFNNYNGEYYPVVYFASGGDQGTVEYPSASPYVVSAGGTTVNRDSSGNYLSQSCWSGTGHGPSVYEPIPSYQSSAGIAGTKRSTTDLSFDADPSSGASVYDAFNGGWFTVGGTSLASPALAGIVNNAGNFFSSTFQENTLLYSEYLGRKTYGADFYDVSPARYDTCTGIGTPKTLIGK